MSYEVKRYDLAAVFPEKTVVAASKKISEFFFNDIPANTSFKLRLGIGGPEKQMTISRPFAMQPKGEDVQSNGLFIENPTAQAGSIVEVVIVYSDSDLDPVL